MTSTGTKQSQLALPSALAHNSWDLCSFNISQIICKSPVQLANNQQQQAGVSQSTVLQTCTIYDFYWCLQCLARWRGGLCIDWTSARQPETWHLLITMSQKYFKENTLCFLWHVIKLCPDNVKSFRVNNKEIQFIGSWKNRQRKLINRLIVSILRSRQTGFHDHVQNLNIEFLLPHAILYSYINLYLSSENTWICYTQ